MNGQGKTRHAARRAVVELRNALGLTQQKFAGVLNTAITTIARYETSHPPSGKVLLRLAKIAQQNGLSELSLEFRLIYLDEVLADEYWTSNVVWWCRSDVEATSRGYLVVKLSGHDQIKRALKAKKILTDPSEERARKPKSQRKRGNSER